MIHNASSIQPQCEMIIVVPVCNEESHIWRSLFSLVEQYNMRGKAIAPERYEIALLVNNTTDATTKILQKYQAEIRKKNIHIFEITLPEDQANVGTARKMLFDYAATRFADARKSGYIATTDADTIVSDVWISSMLTSFANGADAVAGFIAIDPREFALLPKSTQDIIAAERRYRMMRERLDMQLDPLGAEQWPHHYHNTGASLAVTTDIYRRCGGMPKVSTREDIALVRAMQNIDAYIVHSFATTVTTSARCQSRASDGMGDRLAEWNNLNGGIKYLTVHAPQEDAMRISARAYLRRARSGNELEVKVAVEQLADLVTIAPAEINALLKAGLSFGKLWEKYLILLRRHRRSLQRSVPLLTAIKELEQMLTPDGGHDHIGNRLPQIHRQIAM